MIKNIRKFLFPIQYRIRIQSFAEAKKNNESYYMHENKKYKVNEKQNTYYWLYKSSIILCGTVAGICGRLFIINEMISVFVRALIGAVIGLFVEMIALRLFFKESNVCAVKEN